MRTSVKVTGGKALSAKLRKLPVVLLTPIKTEVVKGALQIWNEAKDSMRGSRTGRIYVMHTPYERVHQASAPGEPPAIDTASLVGHIAYEIDDDGLGASVGTNIIYGKWLEEGTKHMEARPWLAPAYNKFINGILVRMFNAARTAVKLLGEPGGKG